MDFIWFIVIGLLAGFIAGQIMKGRGFGFWGNLIVGLVGGVVGGFVLRLIGLRSVSLLGKLATSTGGAVLLLFLVGLIRKK